MSENTNEKYGLIEIIEGTYLDNKLDKKLILALNYVEVSGDEFKKNMTAMVMYRYEGGENRTETAEAFAEYAEKYLDLIEKKDKQKEMDLDATAIDTTARPVEDSTPRLSN